jgi:PKD domain
MTLHSRVNQLFARKSPLSRHGRAGAASSHGPRRRSPLVLECLPDRVLPASFVVTNLADSGAGSLRDAIAAADASPGTASTISFASGLSGTIDLTTTTNNAASLGPSFFVISADITIQGPAGTTAGIELANPNGASSGRFFTVAPGAELILDDLTLEGGDAVGGNGGNADVTDGEGTGGAAAGLGGAILNDQGTVVVSDSTFAFNGALGGNGGEPGAHNDGGGAGGGLGGSAEGSVAGGPNPGTSGGYGGLDGNPGGAGGGGGSGGDASTGVGGNGSAGGFGGGGGGGGSATTFLDAPGGGGGGGFGGGGGGGGVNSDEQTGAGGPPGYGGGPGTGGTDSSGGYGGGYGGGGAGMGGAIFSQGGFVYVYDSTFYEDSAIGGAGNNGNNGQGMGGAIFMLNGYLFMTNATVVDNDAEQGAGVYYLGLGGVSGDLISATNTLFDDAPLPDLTIGSPDGTSAEIAGTADLFSDVPSFSGSFTNSIVTSTPGLGYFGANGGPTPTVPLLPGSPAIGQANPNALPSPDDQRGFPRNLSAPDIGADELQPPSMQDISGSGLTANLNTGFASPLEVQVLDDGTPVPGVIVLFEAPYPVNIQTGSPVAAATFDGEMFTEATTNAQGIAVAPTLTANGVAGTYTVEASTTVAGTSLGPVVFSETNTVPPTVVTGGPYTIAQGQSLSLSAAGSTDPYGKTLTYSWTINGHAGAATGVKPTLTWAQLQSFGLDVGAGTFPNAISVTVSDGVVLPYTVATSLTITDTPPTPSIAGLPSGSTPEATALTLTASATDPSTANTKAGFNYLWDATTEAGADQDLNGEDLTFNGKNPVTLPNGLITGASILLVSVTFQTTSGGVILGYQNQPIGTTPTAYVPALYVGTNGLLYAEIYDGTFKELVSTKPVNDGAQHTVGLEEGDDMLFVSLDNMVIGTLTGAPIPLGMTYDELGTGFGNSSAYAGTPAVAYDPFVGTIDSVQINSYQSTAGLETAPDPVTMTSPTEITFTPPDAGTDKISVIATDQSGGTGVKTASVAVSDIPIVVHAGTNTTIVQGTTYTGTGSLTDAPADRPWTGTVNYGDGTGTQSLAVSAVGTFNLAHLYSKAGMFTVTVTITNSDSVVGTGTFDVSVSGFTVNDGSPQQSMVKSLTYTFPSPTAIEPGAFVLLRNGRPSDVQMVITPLSDGMTYIITFKGPGVIGGSLPDGRYTLITLYKKVKVLSGPPMTENDVNTFVRLFGDADGDGVVNAADKALLEQAEADPSSPYTPDFEYDGKPGIDKEDISQFDKRYKGKLDPPKKAPPKFAGRKVHHQALVVPATSHANRSGASVVKAMDGARISVVRPLSKRRVAHA